ncbi:MAG: ParM/StbA family protein [Bacillota bacterium]|nr:ParM/StbA family protein [Bacillota bacterium]
MSQILGLDVGYGFVKVTDGERGYVFPSVVGEGHTKPIFRTDLQQPSALNYLRIGLGNRVLFVGKAAIRHSRLPFRDLSPTRAERGDFEALLLAGLSLFCGGSANRLQVVTGVPPGHMHLAPVLSGALKQQRHLTVYDGDQPREVEIEIDQIEVVPQPLGTFWSQGLDPWGRPVEGRWEGRIGVLDVGFRTTDLAAIEDGEFIPEKSKTIAVGLATAYAEMADHLLARYGLERETHALDEAVITGKIKVAGREVDITDIRNQAFKELAAKALVELNSTWRVVEFDRLLVSGGGGQALSNYLLPHLSHGELVPDPVTANCKGYLAWARRLWK